MAFVQLRWLGPSGQQAQCFPALRNDGCETSVNAAACIATKTPVRQQTGIMMHPPPLGATLVIPALRSYGGVSDTNPFFIASIQSVSCQAENR